MADRVGSERGNESIPLASDSQARSSSPGIRRTVLGTTGFGDAAITELVNADTADTAISTSSSDRENSLDPIYPTPSSTAAHTAPTTARNSSVAESVTESDNYLSIDDQVTRVTLSAAQPLKDKQKGYAVSMSWLKRVLVRSSIHADKGDKAAAEGEIGPLDNTDLVPDIGSSIAFKDEKGKPFVPLCPGLRMGDDFEIVPEEGWDMIMKWYGLADTSPTIIRYAHNISPGEADGNIMYELYPPVLTVLKLANPSAPLSPRALKEKNARPVKTLTSRYSNFQQWLKQVKELANINMSTKVRVWAIQFSMQSSSTTPAVSRSVSPASTPDPAKLASGLVLDLNVFLSIPEGQRQLISGIKDQTANPNYNGRMTVGLAGVAGNGEILVLEESVISNNSLSWISEMSKHTLDRLGLSAGDIKVGVPPRPKTRDAPQARPSVAPTTRPTHGRRNGGRPLGCTGLRNLGNTCYMNGALQCMRSVPELSHYFLTDSYKRDLNPSNPLSHNGNIAKEYAKLIHMFYDEPRSAVTPSSLRDRVGSIVPAFGGFTQQDSQEFLLFLLDGLQEDLNRILKKPYIERPDSTDEMAHNREELSKLACEHWRIYKARNDSVISDLFAGMYKSTIVCPHCSKVSITFDPFTNLTLQLPPPIVWSNVLYYFPISGKPLQIHIEVPGVSTFKAVREEAARKMHTRPDCLVIGEIYNSKIFKMFDDTELVKEVSMGSDDKLGIFELESSPTDYASGNPTDLDDRNATPDFDSPKADRMLIPVFQRAWLQKSPYHRAKERKLFGPPGFIVVTREEAYDRDSILKKLLIRVSTLTTRDFLNEHHENGLTHGGTATDGDDTDSADSGIKAKSVEGEDEMVNVSVCKETDVGRGTGGDIPDRLRDIFEVKTVPAGPAVPLGFSAFWDTRDFELMSVRMSPVCSEQRAGRRTKARNDASVMDRRTSDESGEGSVDSASDSDSVVYHGKSRRMPRKSQSPLIKPGEGIVLDWNEESYDALFGASQGSGDSLRGSLFWPRVKEIPAARLRAIAEERSERSRQGIPLDYCLDEFSKEETLSENNAWYCPRCKEHRRARKRFELWTAPDILVIHLKRFTSGRQTVKLRDRVNFPITGLDMTSRVQAPEEGKSLIYDLFAVDEHEGGTGGGHYTAWAKNFIDNQWYDYNDSMCSGPIRPEKAVSERAYLLFYRRRSDRPLGGKILEHVTESSMRSLVGSKSDSDSETILSPKGDNRGGSLDGGLLHTVTGAKTSYRAIDEGRASVEKEEDDESSSEDDTYGGTTQQEDQEDMAMGDSYFNNVTDSLHAFDNGPLWSFDRAADTRREPWQETAAPPTSVSESEEHGDLFESDEASIRAVDGGEASDVDLRLASLTDGAGDYDLPATPMDTGGSVQDIPPPLDADDSDDLDVVELKVADDERMHTD